MYEGLGDDGYPTEEFLNTVTDWDRIDFEGLAQLICDNWRYQHYCELKDGVLKLSTGGWSGNESIIEALDQVWHLMYFKAVAHGGHYIFSNNRDYNVDFITEKELEQLKYDFYVKGYRDATKGDDPEYWSEDECGS